MNENMKKYHDPITKEQREALLKKDAELLQELAKKHPVITLEPGMMTLAEEKEAVKRIKEMFENLNVDPIYVPMMAEKEEVMFNLLPPLGIDKAEYYLSLIDYLVEELRKYTKVTIIDGEWLFKYNKLTSEKEMKEGLLDTYKLKLSQLITSKATRKEINECKKYIKQTQAEIEEISKELKNLDCSSKFNKVINKEDVE